MRQTIGLLFHSAGGGRGLFDQSGILLRTLVHLRNHDIDLLDARALLFTGSGNSDMMSVTRFTLATISSIVAPTLMTNLLPSSTFSTESPIKVLISFAAAAERCASLRTSDATTAKPRPCYLPLLPRPQRSRPEYWSETQCHRSRQ
jgi:hypothetical protein